MPTADLSARIRAATDPAYARRNGILDSVVFEAVSSKIYCWLISVDMATPYPGQIRSMGLGAGLVIIDLEKLLFELMSLAKQRIILRPGFQLKLDKNYLNNYNKKCERRVPGVAPLSFLRICA